MARVSLTVQTLTGPYPANTASAGDYVVNFSGLDETSGNQFTFTAKEIVIFHNSVGTAANVTLSTVAAAALGNRTGDVTVSVASGAYFGYDAGRIAGWKQSDGNFYLSCSASGMEAAILRYA